MSSIESGHDQSNFQDDSQIFSVLSVLNEMRMIGQLCDITLEAGETKVWAHKNVLAASSSYFKAMFNNDMLEKSQSDVHIQEIDPAVLKLLIDFMYTGKLTLTENNVFQLLVASDFLQLNKAKEMCCRFLHHGLNFSNCFGIKTFADLHNCQELKIHSHKYAVNNFQDVSQTNEFLLLSYQDLISLISDDSLNAATEKSIFEAAIRWIKHDSKSRKNLLFTILSHVKLALIDRMFLINQILEEPLVQQDNQVKDLVIDAMKYHLSFENRCGNLPKTQNRKPDGLTEFIFAIGGTFHIQYPCEFFDPEDKTWVEFAPTNEKRLGLGVASINRHIYAVGGQNCQGFLSSAEVFDPCTNLWSDVAPMGAKRSNHGVGQLNDIIYAAGGYNGINELNSVERFDPLVSTWFSVPSLATKRQGTQIVALNGSLYVLGGFDGLNLLSSVERYDPREGKWSSVAPMLNSRNFFGAAVLSQTIFVAGGIDSRSNLKNAERYEPRTNAWGNISQMQSKRGGHSLVAIEGLLYALGGDKNSFEYNEPTSVDVEYYSPKTNEWSCGVSMKFARSYFGSIVMDCCDLRRLNLDCKD